MDRYDRWIKDTIRLFLNPGNLPPIGKVFTRMTLRLLAVRGRTAVAALLLL